MPPTLFRAADRDAVKARIAALTPEAAARWGRMTVDQMVCHVADQLRLALGEIPPPAVAKGPGRWWPVKQFAICWVPWPRGKIKAPYKHRAPAPEEWGDNVRALEGLIDRFAGTAGGREAPDHPMFGRMSPRLWGVLSARHLDHHLTQFGV